MRKSTRWMLALAVAVCCIILALHVDAQIGRTRPGVRTPTVKAVAGTTSQLGFEGLVLKIQADKSQYLLGEPIVLYASLSNEGNKAVGVLDFLEPETNYVQYYITKPGQTKPERFLPYMLECPDTGPILLKPGQTITGTAKLFMGQKGWVFTDVGTYKIRATYLGRLNSNELRLSVARGSNAGDRAAGDLILNNREAQRFLYLEGGDHLASGKNALQRVSDEYGASALAGYANFALGANLSADFANFKTGVLRRADLGRANGLLERSATKLPGSAFFSLGLLGQLNKNYGVLKNTAKVNATEAQMQTVVNGLSPGVKQFSGHLLLMRQGPAAQPMPIPVPKGFLPPRVKGK